MRGQTMDIFQLWIVLNSIVFMSLYILLFIPLKYSYKKSIFICILSNSSMVLVEFFRIKFAFDVVWLKIIITIINIVIIQFTALLLAKKKNSYALFIGLSSSDFVFGGNILACFIFLFTKNVFFAMACCTIGNMIVLLWLVCTIREICVSMICKEVSLWTCLIPCLCYITFYFILYFPVSFEQNRESIFAAISLLITMVALYILVIKYSYMKLEEKRLFWGNLALNAYVRGIEVQSKAVEEARKEFQIMRHDLRHKNNLLIELLQSKKYKEAEKVLYEDIETLKNQKLMTYCNNVIINSILCGMQKKAEEMNVTLTILSFVPEHQNFNDYELAMLIANLTENAMQAVMDLEEKERVVTLKIKNRKEEQLLLEITNPCYKKIVFSEKSGLPISNQGEGHGYGMISIQEFVKKYNAEFDCYVENQKFIVRILIHFKK